MVKSRRWPSAAKASTMLHDEKIRGKPITTKQRGLFGIIASGKTPTRAGSSAGRARSSARSRAY